MVLIGTKYFTYELPLVRIAEACLGAILRIELEDFS
jgi:hypothetical protein